MCVGGGNIAGKKGREQMLKDFFCHGKGSRILKLGTVISLPVLLKIKNKVLKMGWKKDCKQKDT